MREYRVGDVVESGEMFDALENISCGKLTVIHLPIVRPTTFDKISGEAYPIRYDKQYTVWERGYVYDPSALYYRVVYWRRTE